MKTFSGRVAAITGAASGIGRALAVQLAEQGCHLALSDVDETGLAETVARCEGHGVKVTSQHVDVASRDAVVAWADAVVEEHGRVNVVVNNAGVAVSADVSRMSFEDFDWLIGINLLGVVNGTMAFLPHLERSGGGHVVNLSSVFGLVPVPTQSAYNTAKYGVRGFTDALRMELEIARSCVSATTVHPGGVKTNIVRNARFDGESIAMSSGDDPALGFDRIARTTPEQAAAAILAAVRRNKRRVLVGPDAKVFDLLGRLPAAVWQRPVIAGARLGRRRQRRS
jgi:NAD(P)-dependent dehydrogenase (short-subunit alcohol dehydrogenase family)